MKIKFNNGSEIKSTVSQGTVRGKSAENFYSGLKEEWKANNTVILNGGIVGIYNDGELPIMVSRLADYYDVSTTDFIITQGNPYEEGLIR
ncbi:hypothetical protein WKH56_19930 [Priestia sp. SB1]|uniref:hypothetical protein n=1 Tax=Priestia sp. SB1 TaxID=3132359 RepID=UPI00317A3942